MTSLLILIPVIWLLHQQGYHIVICSDSSASGLISLFSLLLCDETVGLLLPDESHCHPVYMSKYKRKFRTYKNN